MGRTVDLDMAIDVIAIHKEAILGEADDSNDFTKGYALAYRHICELISALPPAQPEQRWIPVSEGLPENEYVLISKKPTKISGSKWSVAIAIRTADPRSGKIQWRDSGFGVIEDDKVLAWMPLPEPYKEVYDEQKN